MKVLVLDNYDSFTYNLVHLIRELGWDCSIYRNDKITIAEADQFDKILLSPGPGIPEEAGIMKEIIEKLGPSKSILGVCLGFQGIAEVYNARLYNMESVLHGVTSQLTIVEKDEILFKDVEGQSLVGHYHSWAVIPESVNGSLKITAINDEGMVMALAHTEHDVRGVQFHPESIMTPYGKQMILNWLKN